MIRAHPRAGHDQERPPRPQTNVVVEYNIRPHAYDHLFEIGSVIFTVTALANDLSTAAFKVERSGVEKDQLHFLNEVFVAANCTDGLVNFFDGVSQFRLA